VGLGQSCEWRLRAASLFIFRMSSSGWQGSLSLRFVELEIRRGRLKRMLLSSRVARISRDELDCYIATSTVK
jgi:hypothetical protein